MAELKSLGTIFPTLLVSGSGDTGLVDIVPALSEWVDDAFPALGGSTAAAAAWRDKYGSLVDRLCEADGSTVKISVQSDANILAVMTAARTALLENTTATKDSFHATATSANPFRSSKTPSAANTYARLLAVASSMYFAVEAKTRK